MKAKSFFTKVFPIPLWVFFAVLVAGCYDDTELRARLDEHEARLQALEKLCSEMNTNIASMQQIMAALQNNDFVTDVAPISENGKEIGYTITFSKSGAVTIYHGKDGKDGQNGKDGQDGKDGVDGKDGATPVVGLQQDTDGHWYWTLNGEWLLDSEGAKVRAVAVDGKEYDEVTLEATPDNATLNVLSRDKMSSGLSSALSVKPNEVDIKGITIATKAGSITVNSWLDIPFIYKKGDVISIDRTLSELGLSGVELGSFGKSFKVEVEVDSYLPFVITSQAEAGEKVKAKLDTPLAAGTPSSAKRTNAVISVESSTAIDSISDAVIHLQLTAEDGARLTRDCKLVIHYKTLNIK